MRIPAAILAALILAAPAQARPVLVELFTSESCSSCPPADALLVDLARSGDVLALGFHVDYWNGLGWRDRYASPAATQRQRDYAARLGGGVFTPEIVVDGRAPLVGSDRDAVLAAINAAGAAPGPALRLHVDAGQVTVSVDAGAGAGQVLLIGYDPAHRTAIGGGENTGREIAEANVVRGIVPAGAWQGHSVQLHPRRPVGERLAAILQAPDGHVLALGTE